MSKSKKITPHKEARLQIAEQLQVSLPGLIDLLGQEEFDKRVRKAAKVLAEGSKAPKKRNREGMSKKEKTTVQAA